MEAVKKVPRLPIFEKRHSSNIIKRIPCVEFTDEIQAMIPTGHIWGLYFDAEGKLVVEDWDCKKYYDVLKPVVIDERKVLERCPEIKVTNTGQDQHNTFYSVFVPERYVEGQSFTEEELSRVVGWENGYWGALLDGRQKKESGTYYRYKCHKE